MKKLTSIMSMIIATLFFYSCDNEEPTEFIPVAPGQPANFTAQATLIGHGALQSSGVGTSIGLTYEGEGTSNQMEHIQVSYSGFGSFYSEDDFEIKGGTFSITSGDDYLHGTVSGEGNNLSSQFRSSQKWTIVGGSGQYLDASGNLTVQLSNQSSISNALNVSLSGMIKFADTEVDAK